MVQVSELPKLLHPVGVNPEPLLDAEAFAGRCHRNGS